LLLGSGSAVVAEAVAVLLIVVPSAVPAFTLTTIVMLGAQPAQMLGTVAVTVPFSLAEFVFGSLPEATKRGLQMKGYDADGFWKRLRSLNIREIVSIVGEDGETIEIWIE